MNEVFISYSRQDKVFVQELDAALRAENRDPWVDWEDIPLIDDWWAAIQAGIEGADSFVFVISPDSAASEVCGQEVAHAAQHHKRIVPIVYRDVSPTDLPNPLPQLNWVFFRESDDFDTAFKALIEVMDTDLEWVKAHTRLTQRAVEWDKQARSNSFVLRGEDLEAAEQILIQTDKEPKLTGLQREYVLASRKSATKRQRIVTGAVMFGFVIAFVLGLVAFFQFQNAQQKSTELEAILAEKEAIEQREQTIDNLLKEEIKRFNDLDLLYAWKITEKDDGSLVLDIITTEQMDFPIMEILEKTVKAEFNQPISVTFAVIPETGTLVVVANTGGQGVNLRWIPGGPVADTLAEGTTVLALAWEKEREPVNGVDWVKVDSGEGLIGWIQAQYLLEIR